MTSVKLHHPFEGPISRHSHIDYSPPIWPHFASLKALSLSTIKFRSTEHRMFNKQTDFERESISPSSLVAQMVKNLLTMQETWVWSLGQEELLEKGMTTHSSILAWRIPWRLRRVRHNRATNTSSQDPKSCAHNTSWSPCPSTQRKFFFWFLSP